jgi:hypothetical protein
MGVLGALLVASLVFSYLFYRRYSRASRDRVNLRISRDRANFDLEMVSHQVRRIRRVPTKSDDSASLPDSLPAQRSTAASLPPGPPASSTGQSVAEHEVTRSGAADNGVAPTAPAPSGEQIIPRPTARVLLWAFPGWPGAAGRAAQPKKRPAPAAPGPPSSTDTDTSGLPSSSSGRSGMLNAPLRATTVSAPPKRPAPPTPLISAPPAKKTPKLYFAFCREQRPLLPPFLTNGEREKCLSLRWKDLSVAEKATYGRAQGGGGTLAPVPAPTMAPAMASVASTSQQATAEAMSSTDRWSLLWKVEEAKASCRVASAGTSAMTQHAPPPALVVPSNTPVTLVFAAPHHSVAPSSFLAPPDYLLPPNPFAVSAGMELEIHARQLELAELLEHMTEEEALEALGAEMCCWGVDPTNTAPGIRRA